MAINVSVNNKVWCQGATTDAGNRLQAIFQVIGCFVFFNIELLFDQFQYRFTPPYVAGGSPAYPDNVLPAWCRVELLIEGNHPLYMAGEKVQTLGYQWNNLRRYVTRHLLYFL